MLVTDRPGVPSAYTQVAAMLITPSYAAICGFVLLASPAALPPTMTAILVLVSLASTVGALFGYNNYRGRLDDVVSRKRSTRPLAGHSGQLPVAQATIGIQVVAALILPIMAGSIFQSAANASVLAFYAVAFQMRTRAGSVAALAKTTSATLAAAAPSLGALVALDTNATTAAFIVTTIAAWRAIFEIACDGKDVTADMENHRATPVTIWGRNALRATASLCLAEFLLALALARTTVTAAAAILSAAAIATLVAIAMQSDQCSDDRYWSVTRSLSIAFLAMAGASALAMSRGLVPAFAFAIFMLLLADRSEFRRIATGELLPPTRLESS